MIQDHGCLDPDPCNEVTLSGKETGSVITPLKRIEKKQGVIFHGKAAAFQKEWIKL